MKSSVLALSLLAAAGSVQAHEHHGDHGRRMSCDMQSNYSLTTDGQGFVFTSDDAPAQRLAIRGDRLFLDGREVELGADDRSRVRQMDAELRQLVPESERVAADAVDIAFDALGEVARALSGHPNDTLAKLEKSRAMARREIHGKPSILFRQEKDDAIEAIIEPIVSEFVPEVTGGAVTMALKMVFASQDEREAMQARLDRMEQSLDRNIDRRADALEPRAEALCQRLRQLDRIENQLDYRLPGGRSIGLLTVDSKESTAAP